MGVSELYTVRRMLQFRLPLYHLVLAASLIVALSSGITAQGPARKLAEAGTAPFQLTVDSIMRGPDLVGFPPSGLRWSGDSTRLYFEWRRPGEDEASTYVVDRDGSARRKLSEDERKLAPPAAGGRWDRARRRVLFVDDGDIALVDTVAGTRRQITRTTDTEGNPRWARGESHVTFTRGGNLFIVPVSGDGGLLTQLTDVRPRKPESRLTDSQKYLREEEKKLIEYIREQAEKKEEEEEKEKRGAVPKLELREGQNAIDLQLSPDGDHVFIVVSERAREAKTADVPRYVTESSYAEIVPARTNVGDLQEKRTLAVLNLKSGKVAWAETPTDKERDVRWFMPAISRDGKYAVASVRATDNKERWLVLIDPESGKTRVFDRTRDDAWIREGGGFGGLTLQFLDDDKRIWFLSERTGWMHLYTLDVSASDPRATPVTEGSFELSSADVSLDGKTFHVTSTEVHPGERHLYSVAVDRGARTRITTMAGSNAAEVSPDGSTLGLVYSYSTKPPEVYIAPNRPGARARQVTTTPIEQWRTFRWIDPKLITFEARDGAEVRARLYRPEMIGAKPHAARPGVIFVHGAGYLQNAHRYWSSYYREYMFHNLLASRGYVVLDVDYRASAGYGRDWRTAIYRHMGGKDLQDIVDGAKYLVERQAVDAKRVGVYGGSYGGFITLMAMFTAPDVFAAGAALRPVTDWAHYNHGYTSNILNIPQEDAEAYRRSSPIYFAEGLKGALLISHGMVDTNVHFQDSVRLVQRLIELRKDNWELAVYPVENHAFAEETSWADEYKRILKLFDEHLRVTS